MPTWDFSVDKLATTGVTNVDKLLQMWLDTTCHIILGELNKLVILRSLWENVIQFHVGNGNANGMDYRIVLISLISCFTFMHLTHS